MLSTCLPSAVYLSVYAYFESLDKVKLFSGIQHLIIHVIANGLVMPHLLDRYTYHAVICVIMQSLIQQLIL